MYEQIAQHQISPSASEGFAGNVGTNEDMTCAESLPISQASPSLTTGPELYTIPAEAIQEVILTPDATYIKLPPISPDVLPIQEKAPASESRDWPSMATEEPHAPQPLMKGTNRPPSASFRTIVLSTCVLLLGMAAVYSVLGVVLKPTALIRITPKTITQTLDTTITVVSGKPDTTKGELSGRLLPSLTFSQDTTVQASGTGHQPAASAHGLIVFYNAALVPAFIPAGTVLTGASGVQIATDEDVEIPAAQLPTDGQASTTGHAVVPGPQGNIPAGDLYGSCCRSTVFVSNQAFAGGASARDYQMVTQGDMDTAQKTPIDDRGPGSRGLSIPGESAETLVSPPLCVAHIMSDKRVGDEAATVHVSMSEQCSPLVYQTARLADTVTQRLDQVAQSFYGTRYVPAEMVQLSVSLKSQTTGRALLSVLASRPYQYHFSESDTSHFAQLIAGLAIDQAQQKLLGAAGVDHVVISVKGWRTETLPSDPRAISLVVFQVVRR